MIVVEHLTKAYGSLTAVDDVSFTCLPGQVVGFLGPNGAGKSTTLRMLTGLTPITSGRATIGGYDYRDIPNPAMQVGTLLDASAFHSGRTALETLRLSARTMGLDDARVRQMLDVVGLTPVEASRRIGNYSLGMRQRLGVACALLGDPAVLILDEPVNGLDPAGIHWMRGVLRGFADAGGTVLLSSHLLHEIELIADHIVVIGHGRVMAQGATADLAGVPGTWVQSTDDAELAAVLTAAGLVCRPDADGGLYVEAEPGDVGAAVAQTQIVLTELRRAGTGNLERMYLELTAGAQRGGFAPPGGRPGFAAPAAAGFAPTGPYPPPPGPPPSGGYPPPGGGYPPPADPTYPGGPA
ncbi:ABC transporter ATP-binding protein [Gordonia iterans]